MRTRDREQDWIEELGRRRLEALIAELTPSAGDPAAGGPAAGDPAADDAAAGREPPEEPRAPWPVAGRHARRPLSPGGRFGGWVADRLPRVLTERRGDVGGLQHGHVGLLALVLAVAVLLGGWAWVRAAGPAPTAGQPPRVAAPGVTPSGSPGLLTSPSATVDAGAGPSAPGAPAEVVVHVAGRVRRPGIVVLPTGSRVVDAVRRAGGFAPGVGPRSAALNLARVLVDGEQILVGTGPAAAAPVGGPSPGGAAAAPLVSLNTADQAALETLPGIGPVTATAILQWRTENGPFTAVGQLLEVSGIGEATLAELEPHVTL
jgi:competence protein ComEA